MLAGTWARLCGNVTGSLPDGFTSPNSTAAISSPSSCPGYHASITPLTWSSQGMVTAEPVFSTTTVSGLAAATAEMSWFSLAGRSMSARSAPSVSKLLANTTATSAFLAAATAWSSSDGVCGGAQPSVTPSVLNGIESA